MTDSPTFDLTTAVLTNLSIRTLYRGDIIFPCIPAALGAYLSHIDKLMRNLGQGFTAEQQEQVHRLLQISMQQGYTQSPNAQIAFHYELKGTADLQKTLSCEIALITPSLGEQYDTWYQMDADPEVPQTALFGQTPDAKVMDSLALIADSTPLDVLDIGAGDGRNALPIAEKGHRVHAIDLTPEFTADLKRKTEAAQLPITISEADILDSATQFHPNHYDFVLLSEVTSHFRSPHDLRQMFEKTCASLKVGGTLLLNCFVAMDDFQPDALGIEMSQIAWSSLFTPAQLKEAIADLPLAPRSDESALDYEKAHLPAEQWPPTLWYEDWASGRSTFPFLETDPPMELRWLRYQKTT